MSDAIYYSHMMTTCHYKSITWTDLESPSDHELTITLEQWIDRIDMATIKTPATFMVKDYPMSSLIIISLPIEKNGVLHIQPTTYLLSEKSIVTIHNDPRESYQTLRAELESMHRDHPKIETTHAGHLAFVLFDRGYESLQNDFKKIIEMPFSKKTLSDIKTIFHQLETSAVNYLTAILSAEKSLVRLYSESISPYFENKKQIQMRSPEIIKNHEKGLIEREKEWREKKKKERYYLIEICSILVLLSLTGLLIFLY